MKQSLLTAKEASSFLHVHPKTLYKWTDEGKIPFRRINRLLRFRPEDIERWPGRPAERFPALSEGLPELSLCLADYDRMLLKGGRSALGKHSKRWNYGFGTIYVRKTKGGNDRWYVDYQNGEGRRIRKVIARAKSREEALFALQEETRQEFDREHGVKRKVRKMTFNELATEYLENYAKINNLSWKRVGTCLNALKRFFGACYLSDVSPYLIEKYKAKRLNDALMTSSVNRELSVLKRAFNLGITWEMAEQNPVQKVRFLRQPEPRERVLTEEEERRLLEASSEHLKPIICMALQTGMRKSEIANLRWEEVDLETREIEVVKTKSGRKRTIPISSDLFKVLAELEGTRQSNGFVFQYRDPKTGRSRHVVFFRTAFEHACRRAGIKGLTFHDLRHTFASRLVRKGVDLITIKDLLGHSSVRTTERYSHSNREQKQRAVELLSKKELEKRPENVENQSHICHTEVSGKFDPLVTH